MGWQPAVDWADVPPAAGSQSGERVPPFGEQPPLLRELRLDGWQPLTDAARWSFLPYIWPDLDRTWVHDRVLRSRTVRTASGEVQFQPWDDAEYLAADRELGHLCQLAGTTTRPTGRRWLLRGPIAAISVDTVLDLITLAAMQREIELVCSPPLTAVAVQVTARLWARTGRTATLTAS